MGDSVNLQINASDPDGIDTLVYWATGLPDGLSIDPFSGLISGTIDNVDVSPMPYPVTVSADDGNGQTICQTFNWIVNDAPMTAQGSPITAEEGKDTGAIIVASFTSTNLNYPAPDFTAVVEWGDQTSDTATVTGGNGSFTVTDNHTYAKAGTYTVKVIITDINGTLLSTTSTATVSDAPLTLTGGFQLSDPMTDMQSNYNLAMLADANPDATTADYTVSINWGDGSADSVGQIKNEGSGIFIIMGTHDYGEPLPKADSSPMTFTVTVKVADVDGASASTTSTVVIGELRAGQNMEMGGWVFQDTNYNATASDFTAEIAWGDGTTSPGTVAGSNGQFNVTGTHRYADDSLDQSTGRYTITVTVTGDGGSLSGTQWVSVTRPAETEAAGAVETVPGSSSLTLTNVPVAEFAGPDWFDGTSEFSATIIWGDGSSSSGTIEKVGPGLFEVLGSHTYSVAGEYILETKIEQHWNTLTTVMIVSAAAWIPGAPLLKAQLRATKIGQVANIKGYFAYGIKWNIDAPPGGPRGGYIVQHVQTSQGWDYYEVWKVNRKAKGVGDNRAFANYFQKQTIAEINGIKKIAKNFAKNKSMLTFLKGQIAKAKEALKMYNKSNDVFSLINAPVGRTTFTGTAFFLENPKNGKVHIPAIFKNGQAGGDPPSGTLRSASYKGDNKKTIDAWLAATKALQSDPIQHTLTATVGAGDLNINPNTKAKVKKLIAEFKKTIPVLVTDP